jgi:hypothetical protein
MYADALNSSSVLYVNYVRIFGEKERMGEDSPKSYEGAYPVRVVVFIFWAKWWEGC